jgi:hypothetical protein
MDRRPSLRKTASAEHLNKLDRACQWLSVGRGRAPRYRQLISEFIENNSRSPEHILAIGESSEIVDLFELWEQRIADFPGLERKIKTIFSKGPLLREGEKFAASSNRARNDAFTCLVAGTLLKAGIPVVAVEGIVARHAKCESEADLTFWSSGRFIDVECKRPQTPEALVRRAKEACKQIVRPSRGGRHGVIALDCSVLVRPEGKLLENVAPEDEEIRISRLLERAVPPKVAPYLTNSVLGLLLFARIPAMTRLRIVTPKGEPIFRPDSILSWLVVSNHRYSGPDVLRFMANELSKAVNIGRDVDD